MLNTNIENMETIEHLGSEALAQASQDTPFLHIKHTPPLVPILLSGGCGRRLWPLSTPSSPKPFIPLEDGQTLLQKTFLRAISLRHVQEIMTVTTQDLSKLASDSYKAVWKQDVDLSFLLEPSSRDTAAAVFLSSLVIAQRYGYDTLVLVMPSDHQITRLDMFQNAVSRALPLAQDGKIVLFGVPPQYPATEFGYIEKSQETVLRFIEKPPFELARRLYTLDAFLWNMGIFCFSVRTLIREASQHCQSFLETAMDCCTSPFRRQDGEMLQIRPGVATFEKLPRLSLDHLLIEKSKNLAVISCGEIGWRDLGSWSALDRNFPRDAQGNSISGPVIAHKTQNCTIRSTNAPIAAAGLKNLSIIATQEGILIADKHQGTHITGYISGKLEHLKAKGTPEKSAVFHRPWGSYTLLDEGPSFKVKRLEINPGGKISLQRHAHRSEHWTVVRGSARITRNNKCFTIHENTSVYIPRRSKHRLENPDDAPLILIEVQYGTLLSEEDIIRYPAPEEASSYFCEACEEGKGWHYEW